MFNQEATDHLTDFISQDLKDPESIKNLLDQGADPNALMIYPIGKYPLLARAIVRQNIPAINTLLSHGAKVDNHLIVDGERVSMLELATRAYEKNCNAVSKNIVNILLNDKKHYR